MWIQLPLKRNKDWSGLVSTPFDRLNIYANTEVMHSFKKNLQSTEETSIGKTTTWKSKKIKRGAFFWFAVPWDSTIILRLSTGSLHGRKQNTYIILNIYWLKLKHYVHNGITTWVKWNNVPCDQDCLHSP